MNYIPPPTTNTTTTSSSSASLRPTSATAALSSSFNTLAPGAQPAQRPVMAQGARSSYINPTAGGSAGTSAPTPPQQQQQQLYPPVRQHPVKNNSQGNVGVAITSEEPGSNSSRFARRGPLVMNQESLTGGSGDTPGTRSRRESTYSDTESLQQFSPAMLRSDEASESASPAAGTLGMQLQVCRILEQRTVRERYAVENKEE